MSISGYGVRFLETEKFLELCNYLEVQTLNWKVEAEWLEYLEKEKLLFPLYRVVLPKSYATFIYRKYHLSKEDLPPKWQKIRTLTDQIEDSDHSSEIFNVLDKKRIKNKLLQIPIDSEFTEWNFKAPSKKYKIEINKQKNYYQHWQVYHLYELTMSCKQQYLINIFDEKILAEIREKGLNPKKMFRYTIRHKYHQTEYYSENHILFDMLSFYVSGINKCNQIPFHKWLDYHKMEEEYLHRFELDREIHIAKVTICKYKLNQEMIISFIKILCNRYFIYENEHMDKLILMLKKDVEFLCKLLEDGFGFSTLHLIGEIKRVHEHYSQRPLEYILRGEIAKAKDNAFRSLRDIIGKTIKHQNLAVTELDVEEFLEFCDSNSMASIFIEINRFYFGSQNYYGIIQNLISLTMAYEGFLRILLEKSKNNIKGDGLLGVLKSYYKGAKWYNEFINVDNRKIMYQKKDLVSITFEIINHRFHNDDSYNEIIKSLYILLILRNNIAHNPFNISFKKKHPNFYKDKIIELIWFSWQYAKNNYSLATKINND